MSPSVVSGISTRKPRSASSFDSASNCSSGPNVQARYFLDPAHAALVGLIGTERGFQTRELARLVDHIGAGRRPPGIVDEGDDLPIGERNLNTAIFEIIGPEHRTRENGDAFTEAPRVLQHRQGAA